MQKTHIFINKWGLSSIRVDHHVPATYTTRKLKGDIEYREMVFGKDLFIQLYLQCLCCI